MENASGGVAVTPAEVIRIHIHVVVIVVVTVVIVRCRIEKSGALAVVTAARGSAGAERSHQGAVFEDFRGVIDCFTTPADEKSDATT